MATKKIIYVESEYVEDNKISMIEKIDRLNDLQNPDLMDVKYLEYFAANLGYDININKGELGSLVLATEDQNNTCSADEADKYMRFAIRNLPLWYKIKTTNNAIKIMLYSFGMIGDTSNYYTDNYLPEHSGGKWAVPDYTMTDTNNLDNIPKEFYPTPHFIVWIDLDLSENNLNWETAKREQIVNAIESIRPANTVFRKLGAYTKTNIDMYMSMYTRYHSRYIKLASNGDSDYWKSLDSAYSAPIPLAETLMEYDYVGSGITQKDYDSLTETRYKLTISGNTAGSTITVRSGSIFPMYSSWGTIFSNVDNGEHTFTISTPVEEVNVGKRFSIQGGNSSGTAKVELFI